MSSVNKVIIMGRLGQDPELRYTQNQVPVANLSIATSEFSNDQSGERQERTEWHRVVAFNKTAENCSRYLSKGRGVFIEGKLQTRNWEDQSGQKRYTTEILANNVQFLPDANRQPDSQQPQPKQNVTQFSQPQGSGGFPPAKKEANAPNFVPPSFDDVPF